MRGTLFCPPKYKCRGLTFLLWGSLEAFQSFLPNTKASWEQEVTVCLPAPWPALSRVAKLTPSQELVNCHSQHLLPCPWSPDDVLAAEGSAPDAVCCLVSSRIFFPGSHPVRGVQVMKVGKLQLHQGMFPQAMKNLRLVSAHARVAAWSPFFWLPLGLLLVIF